MAESLIVAVLEGEGFNFHYQAHGYHPLLCYDGLSGDLLKAELRGGTTYCSKEADIFMRSLLDEFIADYPDIPLYLRGDSGFASPDLYEVLECYNDGNGALSGNPVLFPRAMSQVPAGII